MVFGHSWGSLLGLLYGETHPDSCSSFLLSGVFLGRAEDIRLFSDRQGTPEQLERFLAHLDETDRDGILDASYRRIMDPNPAVHIPLARAFALYQIESTGVDLNPTAVEAVLQDEAFILGVTRTVLHYAHNQLFIQPDQVLSDLENIAHIPAILVQGISDSNCFPDQAVQLHSKWANSQLWMIENAGHSFQKIELSFERKFS